MATIFQIDQGTSCRIFFWPYDHNDALTPTAALAKAELTLYDVDSKAVVLSMSGIDLLPYMDSDGSGEFHIAGRFNRVLNETKIKETHCLYFVFSGVGANAPEIRKEILFDVLNTRFYEE